MREKLFCKDFFFCIFKAHLMPTAIPILISQQLVRQFIESLQFGLRFSFEDSTVDALLISILSIVVDTATNLFRFIEKRNLQRNYFQYPLVTVKEEWPKNR
jgi:hypothetical protein